LKILKKLTASLNTEFTGSYKRKRSGVRNRFLQRTSFTRLLPAIIFCTATVT